MSSKIKSLSLLMVLFLLSCQATKEKAEPIINATPVTLTQVESGRLDEVVELNATSVFQLKTCIKSSVNGYVQKVNTHLGACVGKGRLLFVVRSKEAENLKNTIDKLDTTFHFKGITNIVAPCLGYVTELNYQTGDYVQDGETLATISDRNSLVFMLELPYSLRACLSNNQTINLTLPDNTKLVGRLTSAMPVVDPISQTQRYLIKISNSNSIPENLIAKVAFIKKTRTNVTTLPKEAILTNETQSEYWIMKMSDAKTAIKVPITKGLESCGRVEILSPTLNASDKILLTGNYGLPDTAKVIIEKN